MNHHRWLHTYSLSVTWCEPKKGSKQRHSHTVLHIHLTRLVVYKFIYYLGQHHLQACKCRQTLETACGYWRYLIARKIPENIQQECWLSMSRQQVRLAWFVAPDWLFCEAQADMKKVLQASDRCEVLEEARRQWRDLIVVQVSAKKGVRVL